MSNIEFLKDMIENKREQIRTTNIALEDLRRDRQIMENILKELQDRKAHEGENKNG